MSKGLILGGFTSDCFYNFMFGIETIMNIKHFSLLGTKLYMDVDLYYLNKYYNICFYDTITVTKYDLFISVL